MTICVAVKVQDCIVFAADSTTSLQAEVGGRAVTTNTYDHANKLYNLHKGLPIAAMTAGIGNFGASSISTISKDFRLLLSADSGEYALNPETYTLEEVAHHARKYFFETRFKAVDPAPTGSFDYWIGGYSAGAEMGEVWRISIKNGECPEPICEASQAMPTNLMWGGMPEAINRLVVGFGQGLPAALSAEGVQGENLDRALTAISRNTFVQLAHSAMPASDAIDLARFLAETTKSFVRFLPGSNSVGGNIDIATITKHEKFKWVARKHYYSAALNPLETDHA